MVYNSHHLEHRPSHESLCNYTNVALQEKQPAASSHLYAKDDKRHVEVLNESTVEDCNEYPRPMQCEKRRYYSHNPEVKVVKEVYIHYGDEPDWLSAWCCVLASLQDRFFLGATAFHLHVHCDDGTAAHYYLLAHSNKTSCWFCRRTDLDSGLPDVGNGRLLQYRADANYVPKDETHLGVEQTRDIIAGGMLERIGVVGSLTGASLRQPGPSLLRASQSTNPSHKLHPGLLRNRNTPGTSDASAPPSPPPIAYNVTEFGLKAHSCRFKMCQKYGDHLADTATAKGLRQSLYGSSRVSELETRREDPAGYFERLGCPEAPECTGPPPATRDIDRATHNPSTPVAVPSATVHGTSKRALVIGINYRLSKLEGVGRLRYAVNDAERVAQSLSRYGFPGGDIVVLTDRDGEKQNPATHRAISKKEQISRLVVGAKSGDTLFFFFSGHGCNGHPLHGTGLVTADDQVISRAQLEDALVSQIPVGMSVKQDRIPSATYIIPYVISPAPNLSFCPSTSPTQATHGSSTPLTFATPCLELAGARPMTTSGQGRDLLTHSVSDIQGPYPERPKPASLAKPAGRVFFWPSTGDYCNAFEAYSAPGVRNGVKIENGIMANVLCDALDNCVDKQPSVRAVWEPLVESIEEENGWRQDRDSKKSSAEQARLIPASRMQLAELWISQCDPLSTIASVLDRPMFSK